ncbi:MAG: DUF1702 family protein [Saprospiraceae bacterium]|nr:DUF1702 family protein [Saprospiraceae bacterium]
MNHNTQNIAQNIEYIQNLFLMVAYHINKYATLIDIINFLDEDHHDFHSLSYESASSEIAYQDLKAGLALKNYSEFYLKKCQLHPFHMQIGLGWALAKSNTPPDLFTLDLPLHSQQMVLDGYGYYHSLFKERKFIQNACIPEEIKGIQLKGYDQGIGRRLWHISKGNLQILNAKISLFTESRHSDLWRGVGIACGYVGGTEKSILKELTNQSGNYIVSLSAGIAIAAYSRIKSETVIPSVVMACEVVCGIPILEIEKLFSSSDCQDKIHWISNLEKKLSIN